MCRIARMGLVIALLGASASTLSAQANWSTYGGNDWNQRYSTLTQINATNVKSLVPRMVFQTGHQPPGLVREHPDRGRQHGIRDHAV